MDFERIIFPNIAVPVPVDPFFRGGIAETGDIEIFMIVFQIDFPVELLGFVFTAAAHLADRDGGGI